MLQETGRPCNVCVILAQV